MQRVIPAATFRRRGEELKPQEGERVERLARVIATAEYVWDSAEDARTFLSTGHAMLGGQRPIEVAFTELGAPGREPVVVAVPWCRGLRLRSPGSRDRKPGMHGASSS